MSTHNVTDNSDEDTNGSFEFVDKLTDSDNKSDEDKDDSAKKESGDDHQWEDVLGSGQLLKKVRNIHFDVFLSGCTLILDVFQVIKPGHDRRPERQDICEIKYECRYDDEIVDQVDSCKILVSESEVCPKPFSFHLSNATMMRKNVYSIS